MMDSVANTFLSSQAIQVGEIVQLSSAIPKPLISLP
jgi:hypothetical protein